MTALASILVLASASPRRSALLSQIGVAHRIQPAEIEERRRRGERVEDCVLRLAREKVYAVQARLPPGADTAVLPVVLGADTEVVIDDEMLGKPRDRADAVSMLTRLSGRWHQVFSAVAVAQGARVVTSLSRSDVLLRRLSPEECGTYWDSGEPRDKAGAYAIQGLGALFVEELRGSYSGVMGLPLFETGRLLAEIGFSGWGLAAPGATAQA